MRTQFICLALVIFQLSSYAFAQWVQTHNPEDPRLTYPSFREKNTLQGTPRALRGLSSRYHTEPVNERWADSLGMMRPGMPYANERLTRNAVRRGTSLARTISTAQSQLYVIDTAIVRSTYDTTRHLYSFIPTGKPTSDLTQQLKGEIWVDALRETRTYDACSNMLTDISEQWSMGQWLRGGWNFAYTYDANNNCLSRWNEMWSNGQLVFGDHYTYTYDANGNVLSDLRVEWSNGQWVNVRRYSHTYDANGNVFSDLQEDWSNGQWVNVRRHMYTYDANGNVLSCLRVEWADGRWVNWCRVTYTNDANGDVLLQLGEEWSNGQWVNDYRFSYTYDASGNMLSGLGEDCSNGQWVDSSRSTHTYDGNGNMLSLRGEQWLNGQWVIHYLNTCTYDANGNMLLDLQENWSSGQRVETSRRTCIYDAMGHQTSELIEGWSNDQWVNDRRSTNTYDANANLMSYSCYIWVNSSWTPHDSESRLGYGVTDGAGNNYYFKGYNATFTYKLVVASGLACQSPNISDKYTLEQNYPNPFNPTTTIGYGVSGLGSSCVRLAVYDLLGREVAVLVNENKVPGNYQVEFDGTRLASGVYICRMTAGQFVESRKMVLTK
jgi:hypothetical protein